MSQGGTDLRSGPVQEWIELGRFGRSHALKGELRFHCIPALSSILVKGLLAYVRKTRGDSVPFRILSVREGVGRKVQGAQHTRLFFVTLDRIQSKEDADALRDLSLWIRSTPEASALLQEREEYDLVGYAVHSDGSPFGWVAETLETPAHPILVVSLSQTGEGEGKGNGPESGPQVLVPLAEPFIESIDEDHAIIHGVGLGMFREV